MSVDKQSTVRCIRCMHAYPFSSSADSPFDRHSVGERQRYPAELYHPSSRPYRGLPPLEYPLHDQTIAVTQCGRLCFGGRKINLSAVFAGHNVGVREVADHVWLISFMYYDLGFFDDQSYRVECAPNPFGAKVLPMSPE